MRGLWPLRKPAEDIGRRVGMVAACRCMRALFTAPVSIAAGLCCFPALALSSKFWLSLGPGTC